MKKRVLVAAASLFALTACQSVPQFILVGTHADIELRIAPNDAAVFVVELPGVAMGPPIKFLSVQPEPVLAITDPDDPERKRNKVTWKLQHRYSFPEKGGIEICPSESAGKRCATQPANLRCDRDNDRKITCRYTKPAVGTRYFYTIRVLDGSTTLEFDPTIQN